MDSAKLNDWLQVIGLFGVVASLIFVGLQMKQDREIALSAATQARTDTTIQDIKGTASNPFFMSALDKIAEGREDELLASERTAMRMVANATLFNFENVHYQYEQGFFPDDRWTGSRAALKAWLRQSNGARSVYEANTAAWRPSFRQVIEELITEIDAEAKPESDPK